MIKKGKHIIKSYMTLDYSFTGIRIQDTVLTPVDWLLSITLVAGTKKSKAKEEIEYNATIAYQKIYFWLDTNLPSIVVVDVTDEDDLYIANLSSNITMYCPSNPHDDILVQLLHAKISALAGEHLIVGEIKLKGSDTNLEYTFDEPEDGYELPRATAEYYTEGKTRDGVPWWFRDDGFCFEFVDPEDETIPEDKIFDGIIDPLDEFRRIISEVDATIGITKEPARIVQIEKWKPKKI